MIPDFRRPVLGGTRRKTVGRKSVWMFAGNHTAMYTHAHCIKGMVQRSHPLHFGLDQV